MKIKKIYSIILIFSAIGLSLVVFLIYPAMKGIEDVSEKILSDKNEAANISSEIRELNIFKKKYKDYKPNLEKIDRLFIDLEKPIGFVRFLEKLSLNSIIVSTINFAPLTKNATINELPAVVFNVSARGKFMNVLEFLEKLERGPYLIRIKNMAINPVQKKEKLSSASEENSFDNQGKLIQDNVKGSNIINEIEANFLMEVATE
jgi:hypothetical protein